MFCLEDVSRAKVACRKMLVNTLLDTLRYSEETNPRIVCCERNSKIAPSTLMIPVACSIEYLVNLCPVNLFQKYSISSTYLTDQILLGT